MPKRFGFQFKYYFLGALFAGTIFVWWAVFAETGRGLEVDFLDVGQGDAIFIRSPNGNKLLIDGGPPNKAVLRRLSEVMPFYDRTLDAIALTHNHLDHYGGFNDVLKKYKVDLEIDPGTKNRDASFIEFENLLNKNKVARVYVKRGMRMNIGGGAFLDILLPVINSEDLPPHDGMLVARLVYGNNSFLLAGDMEDNLENYLLDSGAVVKSDVLKVGHHGSKTSTSERFLGNVDPEIAVISVGIKNKYGHPHKEILERLAKFKIPIFRTDERGTIKMTSDGEKISME